MKANVKVFIFLELEVVQCEADMNLPQPLQLHGKMHSILSLHTFYCILGSFSTAAGKLYKKVFYRNKLGLICAEPCKMFPTIAHENYQPANMCAPTAYLGCPSSYLVKQKMKLTQPS